MWILVLNLANPKVVFIVHKNLEQVVTMCHYILNTEMARKLSAYVTKWRQSCVRTFRNGAKVVCVRFEMAPKLCAYVTKWRQISQSRS